MAPTKKIDPQQMRAALAVVAPWARGDSDQKPARPELASAVRLSLRTLEQVAPGGSVEVRVPPFAAVQCIEGLSHHRGTPPNVVEMDARTWLRLALGYATFAEAEATGELSASGSRSAEIARWFPLAKV
jgi:hypothetical protein